MWAPNSHNLELKRVGGTSNPYLVLGAIVAAGLEGVRSKRQLGDCDQMAAENGSRGGNNLGINDRLPPSIGEARKWLWTALR